MNLDIFKQQWHENLNISVPLVNREIELNEDDISSMHKYIDELNEEDARRLIILGSIPSGSIPLTNKLTEKNSESEE